ncbi:MAG: glycosyltransferase family protein [Pseudomonadota bacterium]
MNTRHGKIVAIIEARMTSTRLPGKVLLPAVGRPLLGHLVERLRQVPSINEIVVATTVNAADEPLAEFAGEYGVSCFRGSEHDVMARVLGAGDAAHADIVVNITGDCPLLDPLLTEQTIRMFFNNRCDYATNGHVHTFPGGYAVQVYRLETLRRSASMTEDAIEREHVTLHMRRHPEIFPHVYLVAPQDQHWPEIDLSLDEEADYLLLKTIFEHFGDANPYFGCRETVALLKANPGWLAINRHVKRKGDT